MGLDLAISRDYGRTDKSIFVMWLLKVMVIKTEISTSENIDDDNGRRRKRTLAFY